MFRIKYQNKDLLKQRYLEVFSTKTEEMQEKWVTLRTELSHFQNIDISIFPENITDILTAEFRSLATIYLEYTNIENKNLHTQLKGLFRYDDVKGYGSGYQPLIASFFMQNRNNIDLSTCYYCDMAYINVFNNTLKEDTDKEIILFLNNAKKEEIKEAVGYEDKTIEDIITKRREEPFKSSSDFDHRRIRRRTTFKNIKNKILDSNKNHFDLDHFLDKERCPIIALSLFNFVPSCQVCNEKLKKSKVLGTTIDELCRCSPTCEEYQFDKEVKITFDSPLIPLSLAAAQKATSLRFKCPKGSEYEKEIEIFKLNERYNFHKEEVLRILNLKNRYSDSKIREISRLIYNQPDKAEQVKEDLFGTEFKNTHHRCFRKMYKDLLKD